MEYPKVSECRLLPSTINRALLPRPLPDEITILPSLGKPYLAASVRSPLNDGEPVEVVLGITPENFLVGFGSTAPNVRASFICVKTGLFAFRAFFAGLDTPEAILNVLEPLTDDDIAELPRLVTGAQGRFIVMKPQPIAPTVLPGGCVLKFS